MTDWRPIETWKEGRDPFCVLGYQAFRDLYLVMWRNNRLKIWEDSIGDRIDASHWMPLPAPPEQPK
jgi:hypothetical protein